MKYGKSRASENPQARYRDWQKQQERRASVRQLTEDAGDLEEESGGVEVSNHLSAVLVAELAVPRMLNPCCGM